jgi:hypothetical protein
MLVRTHSFATGPVMAEPFISPLGFTMTPALSYKVCHILGVFHIELLVETCLEIEEETVTPTPGLSLADNDGRHCCAYAKWMRKV